MSHSRVYGGEDAEPTLHPTVEQERRGELLALRWRDVDLEDGALSFQRSLVEGRDGPVLAPAKTRRSHRVALDDASLAALTALHREVRGDQGGRVEPDRFVFSNDDGRAPWRPNWVTSAFIRCRKSLQLSHFRLYELRPFMATEMLNGGVPIAIVSGRLAHARASTTLNVYTHAVAGGDRLAAQSLAKRLMGAHHVGRLDP